MLAGLARLQPFKSAEARRLALLFAVVYFAQGMWYLPNQTIRGTLKDQGFSAGQVDTFFLMATFAWNIKPVYGLISDFIPLRGRRRRSYFLLTTTLAALAGFTLAFSPSHPYWWLAALVALMGLGLAFTDVLTDALMVENGRAHGLTGAFQSVQWAAINTASILIGLAGGYFAARRSLAGAFLLATGFPLISLMMGAAGIREPGGQRADREAFRATWRAIRESLRERDLWMVAAFIFFFAFSPSLGSALYFHQTNTLRFSDELVGALTSLGAVGSIVGAAIYAPLSRRVRLRRRVVLGIGLAVVGTLGYLLYGDRTSAQIIDLTYGVLSIMALLAFLDLAARACPRRVEATFFALLMSVYNIGMGLSGVAGGYLYDWFGYTTLVAISAGATALVWALVPLVGIDRIEARAARGAEAGTAAAARA